MRVIRAEAGWHPPARQLGEDAGAVGEHPGRLPVDERRVRREREHDRKPAEDGFETLVGTLRALDPDVHVQTVHALPSRSGADALDHVEIAVLLDDRQRCEPGGRMRAGSRDHETIRACDPAGCFAQLPQSGNRLWDVGADLRRELDDRRVQLLLQRARKIELRRTLEEDVDRTDRQARPGVENHHFLLDTDRQRRGFAEVPFDHVLPRMPCTGRPAASHA